MSRVEERSPCRCPEPTCGPCSATAAVAGQPCPSCAAGAHRSSAAMQDHLLAGFEQWQRIVPTTLGSSGISDGQLWHARDAWLAWHQANPCPVRRAEAAA